MPFLTMELVDGRTLDELMPPGGMALERFLGMRIPLADARRRGASDAASCIAI